MAKKELTLEDIEKKQAEVGKLAARMDENLTDEQRETLLAQIQAEVGELEKMALAIEAREVKRLKAEGKNPSPANVIVKLTEAQRSRIRERTKVDIVAVKLQDYDGTYTEYMPPTNPDTIESMAYKYANAIKLYHDVMKGIKKEATTEDDQELLDLIQKDPRLKQNLLQNVELGKKGKIRI